MPTSTQHTSVETFIRFVIGTENEPADGLDGLFHVSRLMRDDERLEPYEVKWLDQVYTWFNTELPCPPFERKRFPADAVSWFRSSAARYITRMWDIAALLREHGQPIRIIKSDCPGAIIYQDSFQIVAEPWRSRRRRLQSPGYCYEVRSS